MKDGGPAFPSEQGETENGIWNPTYVPGMSLRDWFAGMAVVGFINSDIHLGAEKAAVWAYELADAMIVQREVS